MRRLLATTLLLGLAATARADTPWVAQPSGTTERLRGVAAVNDQVAWAAGNHGTCLRTADGGATWAKIPAPESADLDFRDVEAFDADRAYVLAVGPGAASRVFKSTRLTTGALTLLECYRNPDPKGFLDAIAFWDHDHGLALGDPVDGRFVILATDDAGRSWTQLSDPGTMPPALPGEGAFAASGTCLVVGEGNLAWFATGGGATARVFRSTDRGRSWAVAATPIQAGAPSCGIFGLAFRGDKLGFAVGGDYKAVDEPAANIVGTDAGAAGWPIVPGQRPGGFRSAVAFVSGQPATTLLTVGPGGSEVATNGGGRWRRLAGAEGYHALAVAPSGRFAWAVGEGGKVGRLTVAEAIKAP